MKKLIKFLMIYFLNNDTHHPAFAVVDDFLHGALEFRLALFSDGG